MDIQAKGAYVYFLIFVCAHVDVARTFDTVSRSSIKSSS